MTEDQLDKIRANIFKERADREKMQIDNRVQWSTEASKSSWLTRKLCGLPSKPFSRLEALQSLETDSFYGYRTINWSRKFGNDVLNLCNAVSAANKLGLPLKLTPDEVNLLNTWLNAS